MKPPPAISSCGIFSFFGWKLTTCNNGCSIILDDEIITRGTLHNGLYMLDTTPYIMSVSKSKRKQEEVNNAYLLHCRLASAPLNVGPALSIGLASSREAGR
ncbi:unnamed protein product [Musa textilis]